MVDFDSIWQQIQEMNNRQKQQLRRMLSYSASVEELKNKESFLTEKRFAEGRVCFHCKSKHIIRFGHTKDGAQRYRCQDCGKTFVITTNSILSHTRKGLDVWQKYIDCMLDKKTLRKSAEICGIKLPTAFQWRHKILDALGQMGTAKLTGIIEADETFFPVSYKGNHSKSSFTMPRPSRHRGHDMHQTGLSSELVCVPCALSRNGKSYAQVAKLGRSSIKALHRVFDERISEGSLLCTDEDHAYHKFSLESKLDLIQIHEHQTVKGIYNIQRINSYHSRLKSFIGGFRGVATKYLNNYLRWHGFLQDNSIPDDEKELLLTTLLLHAERPERNSEIARRPAIPVLV